MHAHTQQAGIPADAAGTVMIADVTLNHTDVGPGALGHAERHSTIRSHTCVRRLTCEGMCAQEPCVQTHQGAVMIADITGFTALTEDLGRQGAAGVELLTSCMNNFFTLVIDLVSRGEKICHLLHKGCDLQCALLHLRHLLDVAVPLESEHRWLDSVWHCSTSMGTRSLRCIRLSSL